MLALRIALRYLLSKKSHSAVNVISAISVAGVAVATAAIVVVLSVFNGFDSIARRQFSRIDPDLLVTPAAAKVIADSDSLAAALEAMPSVAVAAPVLSERALIVEGGNQTAIVVDGISPEYRRAVSLDSVVSDGLIRDSLPGLDVYPAALSIGVAAVVNVNAPVIHIYTPRRSGRINPANPAASFSEIAVAPTAIIRTERMEYDADHVAVPIAAARSLLGYYGSEATAVAVALKPGSDAEAEAGKLAQALGPDYRVDTRERQQKEGFRMIAIEKWVTFMMLVFILVIATFNIISTLSLMVIEKRDNMATLRFLGATHRLVRRIFMLQGCLIMLAGGLVGIILGVALALAQQWGGFITLGGDMTAGLALHSYPVEVHALDIVILAAVIGLVAAATSQITLLFTRKID